MKRDYQYHQLVRKGTQTNDHDIDLLAVTIDTFVSDSFIFKMEIKLKLAKALRILRKKLILI